MSSLKIIMTDDEFASLQILESILNKFEDANIVGMAENAIDTIELVEKQKPDVAFLDISLPDMDGIELAKKIREIAPNIFIVFVTVHERYIWKAGEAFYTAYILKPIDEEQVKSTFNHILHIAFLPRTPDKILVNQDNEEIFIETDKIIYIEKEKASRYVKIHCFDGVYRTRQTLEKMGEELGAKFFCSYKSFIVNLEYVDRIISQPKSYSDIVKFKNFEGEALVSKERKAELMSCLGITD